MKSGVRKSGWPMPRLMMSRPCAISALARANTAKAFSSPMRSKAEIVRSMAFPSSFMDFRAALQPIPTANAIRPGDGLSVPILAVAPDLQFRHPHHLEDHGDRPADQQEAVERRDRPDQAVTTNRPRIAVSERRVVFEGELKRIGAQNFYSGSAVIGRPYADLGDMGHHQSSHRDCQQRS